MNPRPIFLMVCVAALLGNAPARADATAAVVRVAARAGRDSVVIISADAATPHQSVITVMEAARRSGLSQITFATQSSAQAGVR